MTSHGLIKSPVPEPELQDAKHRFSNRRFDDSGESQVPENICVIFVEPSVHQASRGVFELRKGSLLALRAFVKFAWLVCLLMLNQKNDLKVASELNATG